MACQEDPTPMHSPLCGLPCGIQGLSFPYVPQTPYEPGLWNVTPLTPQVYAVATSTNTPCTRIPRMTGEEKEFEAIERGM